jgi:hypothetical protein
MEGRRAESRLSGAVWCGFLLRSIVVCFLFARPAQISRFFQPGVGRAAGTAHPREHQSSWRNPMMFEAILSALTLVGYLVPQVIWAIRRGQ